MRVFAGMPVLVLTVLGLGLSACGQRGPLILPNDENARASKAIYIIPQKQQQKTSDDADKKTKQSEVEKVVAE